MNGEAGVTVGYGSVVSNGMVVGGASTGGGKGGRGRMEGARVNAGSVGLAIDVAKILAMSWITCNCLLLRLEKGVSGEGVVSAAVRAQAAEIAWSVEEACDTGHSWEKLDRLGNSFGIGFGDIYAVATIVFVGTSNITAVDGMRGPIATLGGGI